MAALNGHAELVRFLWDKVDRENRNRDGMTALHLAAETGHLDCVRVIDK